MAPKRKDDDFVLTLSDDEVEHDTLADEADEEIDSTDKGATKKRKREAAPSSAVAAQPEGKNKKQKKQQLKDSKKGKVTQEEPEEEDGEEEEEQGHAGEDDGALDSEFEFDVGGATRDVTEDFDGWGADGNNAGGEKKNGDKKAVDIDEIIERRQAKKEVDAERKRKKELKRKEKLEEEGSEFEGIADDAEEEASDANDDMSVDFKDDELLAEDGFGMGADGQDESENSAAEKDSDEEDDKSDDDSDDDDDAASDNDSVATPVGHPDDIGGASDRDSDAESEVDEDEAEKRKAFFAPEEDKPSEPAGTDLSKRSFQEFNLSRPILRGLAAVSFSNPTPIQRKAIPVALLGKDIVGSAVTGSGKTAAFVVPILERLLFRPRKVPTSRVAILMPTRELAVQCYNVATKLATYTDITFCQLVGGFSLREQENILKRRPDVIIATPGRFIDHMRNSASFTVDTLEILVLDEADRMLEDGFADELNEILTTIPKSRQTMLFSATMTDTVDKLIRVGLNRPVRLMVDAKKNTAVTLVQEFVRLRPGREGKRLGSLLYLCKEIYTGRVIVFFRQKREAHRVRIVFGLLGLKAAELHGSMSQEQVRFTDPFSLGMTAVLA